MSQEIKDTAVKFFCEEYLTKNNIKYSLSYDDEGDERFVYWTENEIEFSALIDEEYTLMHCRIPELYCDDENLFHQVEEYIQRCNHYIGVVWFDSHELNIPKIRLTCGFGKFFSKGNLSNTLLGGVNEIKKAVKTFSTGVYDILEGKGTAKEIFENILSESMDDYE